MVGWWREGFGRLDYPTTMRWMIPGVALSLIERTQEVRSRFPRV
jgi:hypothetical protein